MRFGWSNDCFRIHAPFKIYFLISHFNGQQMQYPCHPHVIFQIIFIWIFIMYNTTSIASYKGYEYLCLTLNQSPGSWQDMWLAFQTPAKPIGVYWRARHLPLAGFLYLSCLCSLLGPSSHLDRGTLCQNWRQLKHGKNKGKVLQILSLLVNLTNTLTIYLISTKEHFWKKSLQDCLQYTINQYHRTWVAKLQLEHKFSATCM